MTEPTTDQQHDSNRARLAEKILRDLDDRHLIDLMETAAAAMEESGGGDYAPIIGSLRLHANALRDRQGA